MDQLKKLYTVLKADKITFSYFCICSSLILYKCFYTILVWMYTLYSTSRPTCYEWIF